MDSVEPAYGVDFDGDEEKIVAHLFKLYAEVTKDERQYGLSDCSERPCF